jgi:hypothetical protein
MKTLIFPSKTSKKRIKINDFRMFLSLKRAFLDQNTFQN